MVGVIHRGQGTGSDVGGVEITLVGGNVLPQKKLTVIHKPVEWVPRVLLTTDDESRSRCAADVHCIYVIAHVVALVAGERDQLAIVSPYRRAMQVVTCRELANVAIARSVEDLRVLITTLVFEKHEAFAGARVRCPRDAHRLRRESELLAHTERSGDAMHLLHLAETRCDEHAAVRHPIEKGRLA